MEHPREAAELTKEVQAKINLRAATDREAENLLPENHINRNREVLRVNLTSRNREVLRVNLTNRNLAVVQAEVIRRLNLPRAEVLTLRQKVRAVRGVQAAEVLVRAEVQAEAEDKIED